MQESNTHAHSVFPSEIFVLYYNASFFCVALVFFIASAMWLNKHNSFFFALWELWHNSFGTFWWSLNAINEQINSNCSILSVWTVQRLTSCHRCYVNALFLTESNDWNWAISNENTDEVWGRRQRSYFHKSLKWLKPLEVWSVKYGYGSRW